MIWGRDRRKNLLIVLNRLCSAQPVGLEACCFCNQILAAACRLQRSDLKRGRGGATPVCSSCLGMNRRSNLSFQTTQSAGCASLAFLLLSNIEIRRIFFLQGAGF